MSSDSVPSGSSSPHYVYAYPLGTVNAKPSDFIGDLIEVQDPDWIIPGFLVREGLTLFYGDSGSYKTTVVIYMTHSLETGTSFFGINIDKPYKVLLVEQDESLSLLKSHIELTKLPLNPTLPLHPVIWNGQSFNQEFAVSLALSKPDVVFIDAYTSLGVPDITRPESALVFDALRRYSVANRCAFCILHHIGLSGRQMGSALHVAKVDAVVEIEKLSEDQNTAKLQLTQQKVRGLHYEPLRIDVVDRDNLQLRKASGTLKEEVFGLCRLGMSKQEIKARFPSAKKDTIEKYIREYKTQKPDFAEVAQVGTSPNQV